MTLSTHPPNQSFDKDVDADEHYRVTFELDTDDGDVESFELLSTDDGIDAEILSEIGNVVTIGVTGGTLGQRYRIRVRATYASARQRVWSIWVTVVMD